MDENVYLNNRVVAIAIVMLSLISIGLGLIDFERFPIPAIWAFIEGFSGLIIAWVIWGYRRWGVSIAVGFLVFDLLGWILISSFLIDNIAATAQLDISQAGLVREAINRRMQFRLPIAVFILLWAWLRRDNFVN